MSESDADHVVAGEAEMEQEPGLPDGQAFPLNSRRLAARHIRQLAEMLELPTNMSTEELRQVIEGKLANDGREPQNVQVIVRERPRTEVCLFLVDYSGVFLESAPTWWESQGDSHSLSELVQENEALREQLTEQSSVLRDTCESLERETQRASELERQLATEKQRADVAESRLGETGVPLTSPTEKSRLEAELQSEKERVKQIWRKNCQQLAEHDAVMADRDAEIAALKVRLNVLETLAQDPHDSHQSRPGSAASSAVLDLPPEDRCEPPERRRRGKASSAVLDLPPEDRCEPPERRRRGKAPPVDPFTGENQEIRLDDWLPALQRASQWNQRTEEEQLLQLAGHLRGRALQEWSLIIASDKQSWDDAVRALRSRLEPGSRVLAAQDFRHTSQAEAESTADFIRRLERTFQVAYGYDNMSLETRETILYGQLQEGLHYDLIKSPAVSGAQGYKELCVSAKNEEKRQAELRKRQQYRKTASTASPKPPSGKPHDLTTQNRVHRNRPTGSSSQAPRQCYTCGSTDHLARDCKAKRTESAGHFERPRKTAASTKGIHTRRESSTPPSVQPHTNPLTYLFSSDSEEDSHVRLIQVDDRGSRPQCVKVEVQGVPMYGIVDTGADITIIGGNMFRKVAAVARLKKKNFRKADKTPRNYDQQPFSLDGVMDLEVTFGDKKMHTSVYIKMDAYDQLLLSEGVCRQLGIVSYHPSVEIWRGARKQKRKQVHQKNKESRPTQVPSVRVRLVQTVRLPPRQSVVVKVRLEGGGGVQGPWLLEPDTLLEASTGLQVVDSLVEPTTDGVAQVMLTNPKGYTQQCMQGVELCKGAEATVVDSLEKADLLSARASIGMAPRTQQMAPPEAPDPPRTQQIAPPEAPDPPSAHLMAPPDIRDHPTDPPSARLVTPTTAREPELTVEAPLVNPQSVTYLQQVPTAAQPSSDRQTQRTKQVKQVRSEDRIRWRKRRLTDLLDYEKSAIPLEEKPMLQELLEECHEAFSLEEGERGETDLVQLQIDTGDAQPKRQPVRRIPFAVRQEVAKHLREMQEAGVIQPSNSPWASPIVLVKKKDGSLRFCIDYRQLNSVTKADNFPLPRIDDLLDQLGKSQYFSTLDLATGYWQIRVHPESQEKTAFVTHQGLYQFQVMPFGLCNGPAVFQRLMQRVLMGLNPTDGPDFVAVYLDDVLIFSQTLQEHLIHLRQVIGRLREAGLKLKPSKCHFVRREVQYLGHVITPEGLKPNPDHVAAVRNFPVPQNTREIRQFVGLASYYRRFIPKFARIAQPLHALTCKGAEFNWTGECQIAFSTLKEKLTEVPVLAYPNFDTPFVLETDASIKGLGTVLSQSQDDGKLHPVAYASRALTPAEKNYSITELETLAVVWAVTHFHAYLYGHEVTIYTDHSAVKAVLETPSANGKHARWWTKVYGSGVKRADIIYRPGKENVNADALSRNPQMDQVKSEPQVSVVRVSELDVHQLLDLEPESDNRHMLNEFGSEQRKDPEVNKIITFLEKGELPADNNQARKIAAQGPLFTLVNGVLYYLNPKHGDRKRAVVPEHLRHTVMEENHGGPMAGHFSGNRLYSTLARRWWWEGMYSDALAHRRSCPQCAIVSGTGRVDRPPLHPIPVQRAFQIVGVDVMDLPRTENGNKHVIVFQDFLTKWPMVFPIPDQKAIRVAHLIAEEIIPMFGVPEALLSDRGTNLLSHLVQELCQMLGIKKLNTTAYHPQCDGMIERFNRTLKTMIRKHVDKFGSQWDRYLPGLLWAYRNTPHEATGEKPSFLLFGLDCRSPTEAALLPPTPIEAVDVSDYRQELMLSLSAAREQATKCIQKAQKRYKAQYDKKATEVTYQLGDWVLIRFPQEESGALRKLSRPWHGPYRIIACREPDLTAVKVYFPQDASIMVHRSRVQPCPLEFPSGFYWYGNKRHGPGRPPKWIDNLVASAQAALPEIVPTADEQSQPHAQVSTHVKPKVPKSSPNPSQPVEHRYPLRSRTNQKTRVLKARMFQNGDARDEPQKEREVV